MILKLWFYLTSHCNFLYLIMPYMRIHRCLRCIMKVPLYPMGWCWYIRLLKTDGYSEGTIPTKMLVTNATMYWEYIWNSLRKLFLLHRTYASHGWIKKSVANPEVEDAGACCFYVTRRKQNITEMFDGGNFKHS